MINIGKKKIKNPVIKFKNGFGCSNNQNYNQN